MICILYRFYLQRLFLNIKKLAEASLCSFMEPFGVTCERSGLRFLCLVITEKKEKNSTKDRYNVKKKLKMSGCPYIHFGEPLVFVFI